MQDDMIEPLFSCSRDGCREECSYPADMLRLHKGKPICDDCYGYLSFKEQAPDPDNEEETLMWGDLPPFVPPFAARIAALEAVNARLIGLVKEAGEALGSLVEQCWQSEKELTEAYYGTAYCGESLPLCKARAALAKIKEATDGR